MSIQGSINSMLGSVSHNIMAFKGLQSVQKLSNNVAQQPTSQSPQALASQQAKQSAQSAIEAKKRQRAKIDNMMTSLGRVKDLPDTLRNAVYKEYEK